MGLGMSEIYFVSILAIPTVSRAVTAAIALVRANREDIPAVVSALTPWWAWWGKDLPRDPVPSAPTGLHGQPAPAPAEAAERSRVRRALRRLIH